MTNYTKILRIVSVKLEDGTEKPVDDNSLREYLERRDIQHAFPNANPYRMRDEIKAMQGAVQELKSETNSKNASKPKRADVTKEKLVKFRDKFEYDHGFLRGWKTGACSEYKINLTTLNERMKE
jgi:hypothetical protein